CAKTFLVVEGRTVFSHLDRIGNFDSPNRPFGFYYCRISLAGPLLGDFCNNIDHKQTSCVAVSCPYLDGEATDGMAQNTAVTHLAPAICVLHHGPAAGSPSRDLRLQKEGCAPSCRDGWDLHLWPTGVGR